MQLKSVKSVADLPFKGVEFVKVDGAISEVVIGGKVRVRVAGTYSNNLQVLTEIAGEAAERYRVTAELDGFPTATEYHEHSFEADKRVEHFKELGAKVERERVSVLIRESGEISEAIAEDRAAELADEIPF